MDERIKMGVAGGSIALLVYAAIVLVGPSHTSCGPVSYVVHAGPFDGRPDANLTVDDGSRQIHFQAHYSNATKAFVGRSEWVGVTFEVSRADTSTADAVLAAGDNDWTPLVLNWQWSKGDGNWRNEQISTLVEGGQTQRLDMGVAFGEAAAKEFASTGKEVRRFTDFFPIGCQDWILDTLLWIDY